jgi:hypothetical protein
MGVDVGALTPVEIGVSIVARLVAVRRAERASVKRALSVVAQARGDVWITTAGAVFDHVAALPAGVVPGCTKRSAA